MEIGTVYHHRLLNNSTYVELTLILSDEEYNNFNENISVIEGILDVSTIAGMERTTKE